MNVLFLGDKKSVFVHNFAAELEKKGVTVHIFDPYLFGLYDSNQKPVKEFRKPPLVLDRIPKLGYALKLILLMRMIRTLQGCYHICHIHYNLKLYADIARSISKLGRALIVSVWGSDYYRASHGDRKRQRRVYERADLIAFLTEQTRDDFLAYYRGDYREKSAILRLGLKPLEFIDDLKSEQSVDRRRILDIPEDSQVVVVGYNANPHQNHLDVMKFLAAKREAIPSGTIFVFPMTYGDASYRTAVKDYVRSAGLVYKVYDRFMSDEDTARLRLVADVMVNVQNTDQLSGTLLEHLYAGNVVISGDWLPYDLLRKRGVYMLGVDSPEQAGAKILEVLSRLEEYKAHTSGNAKAVGDLSRWSINVELWIKAYSEILEQ